MITTVAQAQRCTGLQTLATSVAGAAAACSPAQLQDQVVWTLLLQLWNPVDHAVLCKLLCCSQAMADLVHHHCAGAVVRRDTVMQQDIQLCWHNLICCLAMETVQLGENVWAVASRTCSVATAAVTWTGSERHHYHNCPDTQQQAC